EAFLIQGDVWIKIRVRAFEERVCEAGRCAVAGSDDEKHRKIVAANHHTQVLVGEVDPRTRSPMSEQTRLDVLQTQRLFEERIVEQVNLSGGDVVRCREIRIETCEQIRGESHVCILCRTARAMTRSSLAGMMRTDVCPLEIVVSLASFRRE